MPSVASTLVATSRQPTTDHARLRTEVATLKGELKNHRADLSKALRAVSNACDQVKLDVAANAASMREQPAFLLVTKGLFNSQDCAADAVLRMKPGSTPQESPRIVPLASRSFLKNLLGIGAATRGQQAQDLATHLLSNGAARMTRADLIDVHRGKSIALQAAAVSQAVGTHAGSLSGELGAAIRIASRGLGGSGDNGVSDSIAQLLEPLASAADLAAFDAQVESATQSINHLWESSSSGAHGKLETLREALAESERQAARAAEQRELGSRLENLRGTKLPTQGYTAARQELDALRDRCSFDAVFHTNVGCAAIQRAMSGEHPARLGAAVTAEIESRLGDNVFSKGAAKDKTALRSAANSLTPSLVQKIDRQAYATALKGYLGLQMNYQTLHRQADHSQAMIDTLQKMVTSKEILQLERFMSTSHKASKELKYPVKTVEGLRPVRFTIDGFSGMPTGSRWAYSDEKGERLFGTHARFQVTAAKWDVKGEVWQFNLREQPVALDAPAGILLKR